MTSPAKGWYTFMMRALRKALALPLRDKQTVLAAAVAVVFVRVALWTLKFPTLLRSIERLSHPSRLGVHRDSSTATVAWAVRGVARRVPEATCLTQALTFNMLLARRGEASDIKIGVAKDGPSRIKSHAWVEQDGKVILGDNGELPVYATIVSLEGAGALLGRG